METTVKIPNREIALAAFDRLRREKRKDAALRLAGCMLRGTYISLGIGDTDWEIDTALHQCGGEPKTGYGHTAHAAERSLFSFINDMYGKRNPAVHR